MNTKKYIYQYFFFFVLLFLSTQHAISQDSLRQHYRDSVIASLYPPLITERGDSNQYTIAAVERQRESSITPINNDHVPSTVPIDTLKFTCEIPIVSGTTKTGAKTYDIPIDIPRGMRDFQPRLSLAYNSQRGNSVAGMGWSIGGLSSITRGCKSVYYDNKPEGVVMNCSDALYLDGVRLIRIDSTATYFLYESEVGQIKVRAYYTGDNIRYLVAFYPEGRKGVFGYTNNTTNKLEYPLTKLTDFYNNAIIYDYTFSDNHYNISTISYNNNSVTFSYNSRNSNYILKWYQGGLEVKETKLLKKITCKYHNTVLRNYHLSYGVSNHAYQLTQVEHEAGYWTLNPLRFYYGEGNISGGFQQSNTSIQDYYYSFDDPNLFRTRQGSFGYGSRDDGIVIFPAYEPYWKVCNNEDAYFENKFESGYNQNIHYYAGFQNPSASFTFTQTTGTGFVDLLSVGLGGNGLDNIVKINNYVSGNNDQVDLRVYAPNMFSSFWLIQTCTFSFPTIYDDGNGHKSIQPKFYYVGDFNGDGKEEVLAVSAFCPLPYDARNSMCYLFDLQNNQILYEGHVFIFVKDFAGNQQPNGLTASNNSDKCFVFDYDGDGKTDICHINETGTHIYTFDVTPNGLSPRLVATYTGLNKNGLINRSCLACEFNGDGLMDLLVSPILTSDNNQDWSVYNSKGNGQFSKKDFTGPATSSNKYFLARDLNGDHVSDIMSVTPNGFTTFVNYNNGSNSSTLSATFPSPNSILIPVDINTHNSHAQVLALKNGTVTTFYGQRNDRMEWMMTGMANSFGAIEKNKYSQTFQQEPSVGGSYTGCPDPYYPFFQMEETLPLLTQTETYINESLVEQKAFNYHVPVGHLKGLGFCGFQKVSMIDASGQLYESTYYTNNHFNLLRTETTPDTEKRYVYDINVSDNKITKILLNHKTGNNLLTQLSDSTAFTYNTYGYPTIEETWFSDGNTRKTTNSYVNHTAIGNTYYLGFLTTQTIRTQRQGQTAYSEKMSIPSYQNKLPLKKRFYKNSQLIKTELYTYDTHGNATSQSVCHYNSTDTLTTTFEYNDEGDLVRKTDPLGRISEYEYQIGRIDIETDCRGGETTHFFNSFNQETAISYPDHRFLNIDYKWCSEGTNGSFYIAKKLQGNPIDKVVYDAIKREVQKSDQRFDGEYRKIDRRYDGLGRLQQVSLPFKGDSATMWNTYVYDSFNRPVSFTEASGRTTSYLYNGMSTTTIENGISTTRTYDSLGGLVSVTDPAGTITYNLASDGQPVSITAPGDVTTTFTYDTYRRRKTMTDPSAGKIIYEYDANGNVNSEKDANGKIRTYTYDPYGRLITETRPEFSTSYTYNSYGDVTNITSTNGTSKEFTYDQYGRKISEKESVDSVWLRKDYIYASVYDDADIDSIRYTSQSGYLTTEENVYAYGHVKTKRLTNQSATFTLYQENAMGQLTSARSSGIERNYTYNTFGLPTRRYNSLPLYYKGINPGTPSMLRCPDMSYNYDPLTGNLLTRTDNFRTIFNMNITKRLTEHFGYDNLNRLCSTDSMTIAYDAKGNLTEISNIGQFEYDTPQKPYAISDVIQSDSVILSCDQDVTYTSFSRPATISEGVFDACFAYNEAKDRVKMTIDSLGQTIYTKYYLGGCYEYIPQQNKEHLYLFGDYYHAPMALIKKGGQLSAHDIYRDVQGSIVYSSNKICSYDAWGRLRNPNTQKVYGSDEQPSLSLGRGYCGHEHLPWFGLINMNARLYDPTIGRFLSPDPFVQMPDNTQSFNRYSYCLNNPLKYTDETGEFWHILVGAVIGGVANLVANWNNIDGFWQGFTSFVVGAGAGASVAATGGAGIGTVLGVSALSGMGTATTNSIVAQTGNNFRGIENVDWGAVGKSALVGGVSGVASGAVGTSVASAPWVVNGINSPALRSVVASPLAAGAGHIAGGTVYGLLEGNSLGYSFVNSFDGIYNSMAIGGAIGFASTVGTCYAEGINPWNGSPLIGNSITANDLQLGSEVQRIKNGMKYEYGHDGTRFYNNEGYLPSEVRYIEYVVPTPGRLGPGPQRIVVGSDGNWYYTPDHYNTFIKFKP